MTWFRNDRRVCENSHIRCVNEGNFYCVELTPVSLDDVGRWMCMVENASGRNSCLCVLNVLVPKAYKAPEFVEHLRALLTEQGTVSLECKVVGVPTPFLRWFKDSKEIKAGDVFALTANPDDPTSLGTYTCEAVNCMGRTYSSSKVHVVGKGSREGSLKPADSMNHYGTPPIFTDELKNLKIKLGDAITLGCQGECASVRVCVSYNWLITSNRLRFRCASPLHSTPYALLLYFVCVCVRFEKFRKRNVFVCIHLAKLVASSPS